MPELLRHHWILGTFLAVSGALAFRFGPRLSLGHALATVELAGLSCVVLGLWVIARGVSRRASAREERDNTG